MPEDREWRDKTIAQIATVETLLLSQGKDIQNIKKDLADIYKKVNWANAKINWFLGGIAALGFGAGFIFKLMEYMK